MHRLAELITERPAGQPGEVLQGQRSNRLGETFGFTYPAVQTTSGTVLFWRDTETATAHWIVAPRALAATFEPGPEWQADCNHTHGVPWRTCDTETACRALDRELNDGSW